MDAVAAYLAQFDHAWDHRWESLTGALAGVAPEEATWQAACYAGEAREPGWPAPGTVHWQVAHLAHCKRYYAAVIRARGAPARPEVEPRPGERSFAEDVADLRATHADLRRAIAECGAHELGVAVGGGMDLAEFLAMAIRHDAWHAAQIAVARRLWRTRLTAP